MFSFRFALVPFVLSMFAVTSAVAGAGTLTAKVTPVSDTVTYSVPSASPPLNMLIGYTMLFKNEGGNTINNVNITFSLDDAAVELVESGLPPGCARVSGTNSLKCTVIQMKAGVSFPATGNPFVFFYKSPTDPTPDEPTNTTAIASKVRATYAETTNGSNPTVNSDIELPGGVTSVTLGTVNANTIKSAISKNGGTLRSGNANVPTVDNKATEELVVPQLPGVTNYTAAVVFVDLITGTAEAQCLNLGHFIQCPVYATSVPDPNVPAGAPLQFTPSAPLSMIYRVHPSNLKMSASQILNSVLISYQKDGETGFQLVTAICPSAGTANNSGRPCIASAQCYKKSTAPTPALEGVCEWKTNNTENGLLKLQ